MKRRLDEIFYEKLEDDNGTRDTGKIIYASMFVNGEQINLYNFKYKNEEEYFDIKGKSITKFNEDLINGAIIFFIRYEKTSNFRLQ